MHNLSISDLNSIQVDEKFTGQLLVNVENGRIVRNYHLPDGAIAGSVEALLELAERARLIKPSTSHHDDDLHFTGCMVSHYETIDRAFLALSHSENMLEILSIWLETLGDNERDKQKSRIATALITLLEPVIMELQEIDLLHDRYKEQHTGE